MKFDLTIKDASTEDVMKVLSSFGGIAIPLVVNHVSGNSIKEPLDSYEEKETVEAPTIQGISGQVDKDGFPWDARIHSGNKEMTGKGVWRKKRGVTDQEVTDVENELRGQNQAPQTPVFATGAHNGAAIPSFVQPEPTTAGAPIQPHQALPVIPVEGPVQAPFSPPPAQPQTLIQIPQTEPVPETITFEVLLNKINYAFQQGKVDNQYVIHLQQSLGVTSITDIAARSDLILYAANVMKSEGTWL